MRLEVCLPAALTGRAETAERKRTHLLHFTCRCFVRTKVA